MTSENKCVWIPKTLHYAKFWAQNATKISAENIPESLSNLFLRDNCRLSQRLLNNAKSWFFSPDCLFARTHTHTHTNLNQRTPWFVGKQQGKKTLMNDTPPNKGGFGRPYSLVCFQFLSGVAALFFPSKNGETRLKALWRAHFRNNPRNLVNSLRNIPSVHKSLHNKEAFSKWIKSYVMYYSNALHNFIFWIKSIM